MRAKWFRMSEKHRELWRQDRQMGLKRYILTHGLIFAVLIFLFHIILYALTDPAMFRSARWWVAGLLISPFVALGYGVTTWCLQEALYRRSNGVEET